MLNKIRLIIDTGTWMKLDKLKNQKIINNEFISGLYDLAEIIITPEIETELNYFSVQSWKKEKTFIIPVTNEQNYTRAINDGFDLADSSIFGIERSVITKHINIFPIRTI